MIDSRKLAAVWGAASVALLAMSGAALADGYEQYSAPPPPADEGRKFTYSFNLAGTSDYVFRGISQTDNDPTIQGGIDLGYGIIYAGWWFSGLDFDVISNDAEQEFDWYGGIKPTWGHVTFDFGAIYYTYPGASFVAPFTGPDLNYWELKAGVSGPIHKDLTLGANIFWSPDYFGETGSVWTFEGNAAWALPKVHIFSPTITGLVGYQDSGDNAYFLFNGFDNYWYWNAGLVAAVDNISFDFRYWGTNASDALSDTLTCINDYCDSRFVFTTKVVVP
jgi:uncharacterized protein (TIGR02001 family)